MRKYTNEMNIIYGICSWGLGHATRSLPIIRRLLAEDNTITIISNNRALSMLQQELGNQLTYIDIPDYPLLVSENTRQFLAKSIIYWPVFIKRIEEGLHQLSKILQQNRYHYIISDGRYDMYSKKIPSFFISHQMRIMNPLHISIFESGSELFNLFFFKRFKAVIVPDYRDDDLSGNLSHNLKRIDEEKLHYVGVLSDFTRKNKTKDIDYLISISGPEPQRSMLEEKLLSQIQDIDKTIVITLGKAEQYTIRKKGNVTMYSFVTKEKREELLNKTKLVVSRSGYSTIMDLAVLGTKALMIPTPGQVEQEYLAQYHNMKKTFYSVPQDMVQFTRDVEKAQQMTGIIKVRDVQKTVENVMRVITAG